MEASQPHVLRDAPEDHRKLLEVRIALLEMMEVSVSYFGYLTATGVEKGKAIGQCPSPFRGMLPRAIPETVKRHIVLAGF